MFHVPWRFDLQSYEVYMFGEDPACFISSGKEINENLIKEILGSKDIQEAQVLKFTKETRLNAEIIVLLFYSQKKKKKKFKRGCKDKKKQLKKYPCWGKIDRDLR